MSRYIRMTANVSGEVEADAEAFWNILMDWPAILSWMRAENPPVKLTKVELAPGHRVGQIPCTRLCHVDDSGLPPDLKIPPVSAETLLHADHEARMIYYCIEGEGPFGMRNYLATTEVDEITPGRARITCSGRWDLPTGTPRDLVQSAVKSIYDSIIHDIALTATGRSPAVSPES